MKKLVLSFFILLPFMVLAQSPNIDSLSKPKTLQELIVSGIQTNNKKPVPFTSLGSKQLTRLYYAADIPSLIQISPSINSYSDNGTGIGYSYFRLRGMDQTRINTTINGIPVNDPENQGVFFNNFADILSGSEEIQIQRGVGTSTNGTSSFGGSVAISLKNLSTTPQSKINLGFGSFGSSRISAEVQTGLLNQNWMAYTRISQLKTKGYRENSGSEVKSYQFSIGRMGKKSFLRFNFFGGTTNNQLSYLGIDQNTLNQNRKANPFVNGESDAFNQFFNQVHYSKQLGAHSTLTGSAYFVKGSAPKFQFLFPAIWGYGFDFFNFDPNNNFYVNGNDTIVITQPGNVMTSYQLDQKMLGAFFQYAYTKNKLELYTGIHANQFVSKHFMNVLWAEYLPQNLNPNYLVYANTGKKSEQSAFLKMNYQANKKLSAFADVQLRHATFSYTFEKMKYRWDDGKVDDMSWLFLNPRIGSRYLIKPKHVLNAFAGLSHREPTRFDYFQDDFAPRDVKQNEILPERVFDVELGYQYLGSKLKFGLNLFSMNYSNQIIGTGALNNFGYAITGNVKNSFRRGIEIDLFAELNQRISIFYTASFSQNKIKKIDQTYFNTDLNQSQTITFSNSNLLLSPNAIQNLGIQSNWFSNTLQIDLTSRLVSYQYLENTENPAGKLNGYQLLDFSGKLELGRWISGSNCSIGFRVNNVLNEAYSPAGSMVGNQIDNNGNRSQTALFFPAAGRNYFLSLMLGL